MLIVTCWYLLLYLVSQKDLLYVTVDIVLQNLVPTHHNPSPSRPALCPCTVQVRRVPPSLDNQTEHQPHLPTPTWRLYQQTYRQMGSKTSTPFSPLAYSSEYGIVNNVDLTHTRQLELILTLLLITLDQYLLAAAAFLKSRDWVS